jgi:hypothetical protein
MVRIHLKDPLGNQTYRAYFVLAYRKFSMMLQWYRPGAQLPWHQDGPADCPSICFELWNPGTGGFVGQNCRRFGDIIIFNGANLHAVEPSNRHRVSLIFQYDRAKLRELLYE